jgi:hypothetical protein
MNAFVIDWTILASGCSLLQLLPFAVVFHSFIVYFKCVSIFAYNQVRSSKLQFHKKELEHTSNGNIEKTLGPLSTGVILKAQKR